VSKDDLERFVRFLEKDKLGKLNYMDFISRMCKVSNKNHNPFKSIVNRINFFLKQNSISANALLKRLAQAGDHVVTGPGIIGIPVSIFAEFLKQKVEKKRDIRDLERYSTMVDIDKDGFITEADVVTCIKNLNNAAFFRNGGSALA
jgi:Ca2+-binding EF-hand superfamily protein